jgi:hypothetical protein
VLVTAANSNDFRTWYRFHDLIARYVLVATRP